MKYKVKYAILKYIPNLERNEKINIAVTLHSPKTEQLETIIINNWNRVKKFDDEADVSFLKKYVSELKEQFTANLVNNFDGMKLNDLLLLDELTKFFVNKFIFEIHEIDTQDNFDSLLKYLKDIYLHYDVDKSKRLTEKESKIIIEKHLLENNISYERRGTKNSIQEKYGNNINFDYKIDENYYKIIFLNEENYSGYISMLKMWITNAMMLKEENKKLIFVIDDLIKNEKTKSYKEMLSNYSEILSVQEFINIRNNK